jgi:hypothetical protein
MAEIEAAAAIGATLKTYRKYEKQFPPTRSADRLLSGFADSFGV